MGSGTAALMRPDICQEVHQLYLECGADVIITHSYTANPNVMKASGNAARCAECIFNSAALARRACANHAAKHATDMAHAVAAASASSAKEIEATATAVARMTTSRNSNKTAVVSSGAAS